MSRTTTALARVDCKGGVCIGLADNYQFIVWQVVPDTVVTTVQNEAPKVEREPSVSASSSPSSRSHESSSYDNMRGFDPASEDDMEDNGMSRYMENNDEEGWD